MSFDCNFNCELAEPHNLVGGMYAVGGTTEAWLNITYNYSPFFYAFLDEDEGLGALQGKAAKEVVDILEVTLSKMSGRPSENYWEATEGNAKAALEKLYKLAELCPPDAKLTIS